MYPQMKKLLALIVLCVSLHTANAQSASDELSYIRTVFGKEKKELIKQFMNLNDADAAKFWPIYDEYTAKQKSLGDDRIAAINEYANQYAGLTDDQAKSIAGKIMKNDLSVLKLQQKYFKKISKSLSPLKAVQFMQADQYIQTTIKSAVQDAIPFIGEFEKTNKH
jgi:hypothetical protein